MSTAELALRSVLTVTPRMPAKSIRSSWASWLSGGTPPDLCRAHASVRRAHLAGLRQGERHHADPAISWGPAFEEVSGATGFTRRTTRQWPTRQTTTWPN